MRLNHGRRIEAERMAALKLRFAYTKKDEARYIAHLDLTRVFDRALRRANIDVKYSEGFNPHPKIAFGPPLAVGIEGEREYVDIEVKEAEGIPEKAFLADMMKKLEEQLPAGVRLTGGAIRSEKSKPLMASINLARYQLVIPLGKGLDANRLTEACEKWLKRDQVITVRTHKGKTSERNIRAWVKGIELLPGEPEEALSCREALSREALILRLDIATGNEGSVRPGEVLESICELENLSLDLDEVRTIREGLYVASGGKLMEPLKL